jgi:integrase
MGTRGPLSNRSSVVRILDKCAYQAQIGPIKPHGLRHTFATRYLEASPMICEVWQHCWAMLTSTQ